MTTDGEDATYHVSARMDVDAADPEAAVRAVLRHVRSGGDYEILAKALESDATTRHRAHYWRDGVADSPGTAWRVEIASLAVYTAESGVHAASMFEGDLRRGAHLDLVFATDRSTGATWQVQPLTGECAEKPRPAWAFGAAEPDDAPAPGPSP